MVTCQFCNSTNFTSLGELGSHWIYRCRNCGMDHAEDNSDHLVNDDSDDYLWEEIYNDYP